MARSNQEIAADVETISTWLSGSRAGKAAALAAELRGEDTTAQFAPKAAAQAEPVEAPTKTTRGGAQT